MKKSFAVILILALILSFNALAAAESVETADASTMRLARTEGSVLVKDEAGTALSWQENIYIVFYGYPGSVPAEGRTAHRRHPSWNH